MIKTFSTAWFPKEGAKMEVPGQVAYDKTADQVKVSIKVDGKKYAFRCTPEQFETFYTPEYGNIPLLKGGRITA